MITFNEWLRKLDEVLAQGGVGLGLYQYPDDGTFGLIVAPEEGGEQKITSSILPQGIKAMNFNDPGNPGEKYYEIKTQNRTYVVRMADDVARKVLTTFFQGSAANRGV